MNHLLFQLADSAFPSGGFAHSAGLEAAMQAGEVRDAAGLERFATEALWQAGHGSLPLVSAAHRNRSELSTLDARAETFLTNHVQRRASRVQGRALLDTAARIFPAPLGPLREEARSLGLKLHHAPLFGAAVAALGVALEETQRLHLWQSLRAVISAAVRLGLVGTHEAQSLQARLAPSIDQVFAACAALGPTGLAQTSPLLDLFSATHDRLYSRLFQS